MEANRNTRLQLRLQGIAFVVLLLAAAGLLAWLSTRYTHQWDWTAGGRNSLALLSRMPGPVNVTAFARESGMRPVRKNIQQLVDLYRRYKPDMHLEFINPDTAPEQVRREGITLDGELIVSYQGRSEHVKQLSEQTLTNTLQRLLRGAQRHIVFTTGHGERDPHGRANFDYGEWVRQLQDKGISADTINLAQHPSIPADTSLLVIAGPRVDFLAGEVKLVQEYLKRGGNLLWLHDPGALHGLQPVAQELGLTFAPGTIVDPTTRQLGISDPAFTIVASYDDQAIVRDFRVITIFPQACGLQVKAKADWHSTPFLQTAPDSWSETGALHGVVTFDKGKDIAGPLNIGVALHRTITTTTTPAAGAQTHDPSDKTRAPATHEQRVVIVGDGDFLSNSFLGNQGNLDLGAHRQLAEPR